MSHIGCKHLDYESDYLDCKLIKTKEGWQWWKRGETWLDYEGAPVNVQFCKIRGRMNGISQCINPNELPCYEEQ